MDKNTLNRPLASYVVVQSALVMVILAASHAGHPALVERYGLGLTQLQLSLLMVPLAQLPVAAMFVRREIRNLTSSEGWVLGGAFVGFTLLAEGSLQVLVNQIWPALAARQGLGADAATEALVFGVSLVLLGFIVLSFLAGAIFRLAVRNNLHLRPYYRNGRLTRPKALQSKLFLYRALGAMSAGLAGIGIGFAMGFGWTAALASATVVVVAGSLFAAVPRVRRHGQVTWQALWLELLPVGLTGLLSWAVTGAGVRFLRAGGPAEEIFGAVAPNLVATDLSGLGTVSAQLSGILLILLCANVVIVWAFVAYVYPLLRKSQPERPLGESKARRRHEPFANMPGFSGSHLTRDEAMAMIRTAREIMAERQSVTRTVRPVA